MARVVIDWRALARRALAMVESLDDDATVDSDSLRQFAGDFEKKFLFVSEIWMTVVREGAHRKSNNDFWICFDNVRRLNLVTLIENEEKQKKKKKNCSLLIVRCQSNRAMFRARLATRGTAHNRLFKQIYCDTMRLWGCIECERVCFNFHFGHVLHEVCLVRANKLCRQTKQPEKYTLLQRGELNSKHRELRDTVEEFQFLVKNVGSPISTVWPRQVAAQHRALGAPRPRVDKQHCAMCKCFKDSSALLL